VEDKRPLDGSSFFVRKDKQANTTGAHNAAVGLFIVFSPTGKTSKPTATLQGNTTGDGNVAVGQGSSFCQKRQASRIQALDGSFLSEKTSKQLSTGYPQVIQGPWSKLLQTRTKNPGQRTKEPGFLAPGRPTTPPGKEKKGRCHIFWGSSSRAPGLR